MRRSRASAYAGNYLVDMLPSSDPFPDTTIFASDGHQTIPLSGSTELEPGDTLGIPPAPVYYSCGPQSGVVFLCM